MKTILVSLDLSEHSDASSAELVELTAHLGDAVAARVWLIHVVDPDIGPEDRLEFVAQDIRDYISRQLRKERATLTDYCHHLAAARIDAHPLMVRGRPAETILQEVARHHADLLVMGWPRHGSIYRTLLGSVTDSVIRDCPCPVLVMPQVTRPSTTSRQPRLSRQPEPSPAS
jgi:nucleotide-binding universal stress UspA family protein